MLLLVLVGCGHSSAGSSDASVDAEVFVDYAGTVVVQPHGAMSPITNNITVGLGTWSAKADDCTLMNLTNDAGVLSFNCGGSACTCTYGRVDARATGRLAEPMLTLHWSKLSFDDEVTDYDFTGARQ